MQPPNPNYPPPNHIDPTTLYYQQSHPSNYSYYYPNHHLQPPNPNYPPHTIQSDSSIPSYDPYYIVAPSNGAVNPPEFDPNSYPGQSYGYEYPAQQPGGVVYPQYQAVGVDAMTVPYYSDPNAASGSNNWAVSEVTNAANGVTLPPNGMHQYVPAKPNPVSLLNRRPKIGSWKKEPKTKVVQSAWCEVCRVSCDTKDVLDKHKSGKKHLKNLEKQGVGSAPSSLPVPVPVPVASAGPAYPVIGPPENPNKKATQSATKVVQSAWCDVCKIRCDTIDVLNVHNSGKKHKKNMEKVTRASVPVTDPVTSVASGSSVVGLPVNPGKAVSVGVRKSKKKAASSLEDLETKRRKVLEGGAAVSTVKTCVTCNVVCNSETVFQHHIQGQKHMTMIVKLAAERMNIAASAM